MSGWCAAFIAATSRELKASSPFFISARRCVVRLVFWVVVVMSIPFLGRRCVGSRPEWPWLRLCESHLLCDKVVEHPHRKESEESPILKTLRNDRVACLRFRRAECHMDGFAQTLGG